MRAKKSLGQNFLRDESVVRRIVDALDLTERDTVVEIGPGTGALTRHLIERAGRIIAVEFDRDLITGLEREFGRSGKFELVNADALQLDLDRLSDDKVKVIGNLPYNVATPILQRLAAQRENLAAMVLMFQREVVERITAEPGTKQRGYLSVLSQNAFAAEKLFDVAPTAFAPVPKVWSSVVRFIPKPATPDEAVFLRLVSIAFAHKRKTLLNNLKVSVPHATDAIAAAGIDGIRRAETLSLDEWRSLFTVIQTNLPDGHSVQEPRAE